MKMEKGFLISAVLAIVGVGLLAGSALATQYVEEYTGYQEVGVNDSYNFDFDFWFPNNWQPAGDDSALDLTSDASWAFGDPYGDPYVSASLYIDFTSEDGMQESGSIGLTAWWQNGASFDLGTAVWDDDAYSYTYDFNSAQLAAIEDWGWATITITGSTSAFAITKVGMSVDTAPVPEPATMLLFGTGLAGLAGVARRKKAQKK